jgi:hypothetical protein
MVQARPPNFILKDLFRCGQALSEAGGITDYAKQNAIYVLRNENGSEFSVSIRLQRRYEG